MIPTQLKMGKAVKYILKILLVGFLSLKPEHTHFLLPQVQQDSPPWARQRVGFLKTNSCPEQNEMIIKCSLLSLLSQSLLLSSKVAPGLPTDCAECSSRDCEENGESRLDGSQSFSEESLRAAPNS